MSLRLAAIAAAIQLAALGILAGCAPRSGLSAVPTPDARTAAGLFRQRLAGDADAEATRARLRTEAEALRREVEDGHALRDRIQARVAAARGRRAAGEPLSGADLDGLHAALREGLDRTARVFTTAIVNEGWLDEPAAATDLRLAGTVLSLAASLSLYESWLAAGAALADDPALRRTLDRGDSAHGVPPGVLRRLAHDVLDPRHRRQVRRQVAWIDAHRPELARLAETDPALRWAWGASLGSPALGLLSAGAAAELADRLRQGGELVGDDALRLGAELVGGTSKLFGNAMGAVQVRHGRLWRRPEIAARVAAVLRPGDLLLEKTPFRLTDRFIPGHWGHVAAWVGDADQLRALGLWEDPAVAPHHEALAAGRGVCEALRDGVQLNTLDHFLDIDDLAVLRPRDGAHTAEHVRACLRQLGKAYDFNFDVETSDRIVCSELAWAAYTDLPWTSDRTLGRFTISPDAVARLAVDGGPLAVIELWSGGVRCDGDLAAAMAGLLARP